VSVDTSGALPRSALMEMTDLSFTYPGPPPVHALVDVNVTVATAEYVAVVGPSGSGKSTLLNVMGLLDRATGGTFLLAGEPVTEMTERERSTFRGRHVGFVFQSFHLMPHRTVLENVALSLLYRGTPRKQRLTAAAEALGRVGLGDRGDSLPGQLSGGQRQRVAIARALAGQPSILLCDEPTGNLDSVTAQRILDLIGALHTEGQTIVIITHDGAVADRAQRQLRVRDGRVSEE
jgi:putative ABC transport system ATP-binding protein